MNILLLAILALTAAAAKPSTREEKNAKWIAQAIQSVNAQNTDLCKNTVILEPKLIGDEREHKDAFCANVERVARHNMLESSTYKQGISVYTYLRPEDFERLKGFLHSEAAVNEHAALPQYKLSGANVPDEFDCRDHEVVTDMQAERDCRRSSWAFSAVGALVGQYVLKHNGTRPFDLSVQDLIDCSRSNRGCHGDDRAAAFRYVKEHGNDSDYPYTAMVCCHLMQ